MPRFPRLPSSKHRINRGFSNDSSFPFSTILFSVRLSLVVMVVFVHNQKRIHLHKFIFPQIFKLLSEFFLTWSVESVALTESFSGKIRSSSRLPPQFQAREKRKFCQPIFKMYQFPNYTHNTLSPQCLPVLCRLQTTSQFSHYRRLVSMLQKITWQEKTPWVLLCVDSKFAAVLLNHPWTTDT